MQRIVVLLPDPFGPRKPVTRPGWTSKLRSSTATVLPNRLVRLRTSIIGSSDQSRPVHPVACTSVLSRSCRDAAAGRRYLAKVSIISRTSSPSG